MSSYQEAGFQSDLAPLMRIGVVSSPVRTPVSYLRGESHGWPVIDHRMPVRTLESPFGHLPPWAQPVWAQLP